MHYEEFGQNLMPDLLVTPLLSSAWLLKRYVKFTATSEKDGNIAFFDVW